MVREQLLRFPEGFKWGASISKQQASPVALNDWVLWEQNGGLSHLDRLEATYAREKIRHYEEEMFVEDVKRMKELGLSAYRLSFEWSDFEPEEGEYQWKELDSFQEKTNLLRSNGIEPFVTLWHFVNPLHFAERGGWLSDEAPQQFVGYVGRVVERLRGSIKHYIPINEPEIYSVNAFLRGIFPPGRKGDLISFEKALNNFVNAHKLSYDVIKQLQPDAQVGIAKNNIYFEVKNLSPQNRMLKRFSDWWWNFRILDKIGVKQDFIGLNHYFSMLISNGVRRNENGHVSDLDWDLHPQGIHDVIMDLHYRYGLPIYITENGVADRDDRVRSWYTQKVLRSVHQAVEDGADVRGYFPWAFIDNVEWGVGVVPFGLYDVDLKTGERRLREGGRYFGEIVHQNGLLLT